MDIENDPTIAVEKAKWHNRRDEAYGLLCLNTSRDLLFNLDSLTTPNEVWVKIQSLFRNTYELRGHQLENESISLSQSNFQTL